ncbi:MULTISPECIES: hypothetical protein [unclassified Idiomarina]|uniref:hypothetical protein n=1 Tax=unclassified Idiomarina TaxID=2614829 RepID=UPI000C973FF0|nr:MULTISPECIES: hypothetical protein [unclassified Idiomarina]MAD52728.1 hypothetical protein [Idiomarinaceae bacterium]NQZ04343.1 hypothetical protein [Idiomarina sp.]
MTSFQVWLKCYNKALLALLFILISCSAMAQSEDTVVLSGPTEEVRAGYFVVELQQISPALRPLSLQVSDTNSFTNVLQTVPIMGDFNQVTLTGFESGDYYIRAVHQQRVVSQAAIKVTVEHYPIWQALTLFVLGALLFLLLLLTLIMGHKKAVRHD